MTKQRLLENAATVQGLAKTLEECSFITKLDKAGDSEAWTLAHSFSDLERSFCKIIDQHLVRLLKDAGDEREIKEVLLDIGEELRHILYHIRDPQFYQYLD